jgi:hypothetical protein
MTNDERNERRARRCSHPRGWMRSATVLLLAATFAHAGVVRAQDDPDPGNVQRRAAERFDELVRRMTSLRAARRDDPNEARVLGAGARLAQEREIARRLAVAHELIQDERFDEALEAIAAIRADLDALVDVLLDRGRGVEETAEEVERLRELRDRVAELSERQAEAERAARATDDLEQRDQELGAAEAELDALQAAQEDLAERTRSGAESAPALAVEQRALRERTDAVAVRMADTAEASRDQVGELDDGAGAACAAAASAMGEADGALSSGDAEAAGRAQRRALEQLAAARQRLAEDRSATTSELARERARGDDELGRAQEEITAATRELAEDMATPDEEGDLPDPGSERLAEAVDDQEQASSRLAEGERRAASGHQADARAQLEQAEQELEDAIEELQRQMQDQVLRSLEERFTAMLAEQDRLSARTVSAGALAVQLRAADPEADVDALIADRVAGIEAGERALATTASEALQLLVDEGTSTTFPVLVDELREDLVRAADSLRDAGPGPAVRAIQRAIEERLKLLIDTFRNQIEQNESGGGDSGQSGGEPSLVPLSAEIRLLLLEQRKVNDWTRDFDARVPAERRDDPGVRAELAELARRQTRVEELARRLAGQVGSVGDPTEGPR